MKQIDLEPEAYRLTGRQRIVRSILHKPVFMTVSTVLAVWFAASIGVPKVSQGVFDVPDWLFLALMLSWIVAPAFFIWAMLNDGDRTQDQPDGRPSSAMRRPELTAPAPSRGAPIAEISPSSPENVRQAQKAVQGSTGPM